MWKLVWGLEGFGVQERSYDSPATFTQRYSMWSSDVAGVKWLRWNLAFVTFYVMVRSKASKRSWWSVINVYKAYSLFVSHPMPLIYSAEWDSLSLFPLDKCEKLRITRDNTDRGSVDISMLLCCLAPDSLWCNRGLFRGVMTQAA